MLLVLGLLAGVTVVMAIFSYHLWRQPDPLASRLQDHVMLGADPAVVVAPYYQRRLFPLAQAWGKRWLFLQPILQRSPVENQLAYAAYPGGLRTASDLLGWQLLVGAACLLLAGLVGVNGGKTAIFSAIFFMAMGLYAPTIWLSGRATERQRKLALAVPDFVDQLTICVEGGLGFDNALNHIVKRMTGPLAEELNTFRNQLNLGIPRSEAFQRLKDRTTSEDLHILIDMVIQGQELGTPITDILASQAKDMRVRRLQRARETGAKAAPKITLVTTILIAPAILCIFLSVLVFFIMGEMSGSGMVEF